MPIEVNIENIENGMVLAKAITSKMGQVLLGADVKLEIKHKNLFKLWGIKSITIQTSEVSENEGINQGLMLIAKQEFMKNIVWEPQSIFEKEIMEISILSIYHTLVKSK